MSRAAFICETPYQIFNALRVIEANGMKDRSDMFISDRFADYEQITERINETGLCRNAAVFRYELPRNDAFVKKNEKYIELLAPVYYQNLFGLKDIRGNYDEAYMSTVTPFIFTFVLANRIKKVFYFEDGTGSYLDMLGYSTFSKVRKAVCSIRGINFFPLKYYVNSVGMVMKKLPTEYIQIPVSHSEEFASKLSYVFTGSMDYQKDMLITQKKILCISMPDEAKAGSIASQKATLDALEKYRKDTVVKLHPRETDTGEYDGYNIARRNTNWEMECLFTDMDDKVIIATFSTAQITPKLLYDKEPYLIFTYPLNGPVSNDIEMMITRLTELYRQPEKVCVVTHPDELKRVLEKAMS